MESPQSIVSPFMPSSMFSEPENQNFNLFPKHPNPATKNPEKSLGVLDVYIHQARDIQNICIYHKQDVYAKICITSNPEKSLTTETVNGGGKNPVFNETLQINIPTIDSSLKCEIYMLSRVRSYLEDQLLGFTLIPLSEILIENGKLEKEFTLSSTDLFHSPSGFVNLSLSYTGFSPDVTAIHRLPPLLPPRAANGAASDSDLPEFDKIEFPDPKIVNENHIMVTEYLETAEVNCSITKPAEVNDSITEPAEVNDSLTKPAEVNDSITKPAEVNDSITKPAEVNDGITEPAEVNDDITKPAVVQQDFVDLYMKSMQQFTESLAKMKLPLDMEKEGTDSGNSGSDLKIPATPNGTQPRVFYGSRAFF